MNRTQRALHLIVAMALGGVVTSCSATETAPNNVEQDVRGVYTPVFNETFVMKLYIGDTVRAAKASQYEGYADFGALDGQPLLLNIGEFCGREDILCPYEIVGDEMVVDQVDPLVRLGTHGLRVDPGAPPGGPDVLEGIVDHNRYDAFELELRGLGGGACQTLAGSSIEGRFTHTYETESEGKITWEPGERVDGIKNGRATVSFPGTCGFGPTGVSFTMSLEHAFIAYRAGDLKAGQMPATSPDATSSDTDEVDASQNLSTDVPSDVQSDTPTGDEDTGPATAGGDAGV